MKPQQFNVGDRVQSTDASSDVQSMKDRWHAVIAEVRHGVTGAPDGCCYITHGRWESEPAKALTSRQLWADTLELESI